MPETAAPAETRDPYAALRHTAFRRFLVGRAVFLIGGQMQMTAVGWQIYERLGSKLALGMVGLVQIIPVIVLALPAGHVADHFDRRRIVAGGLSLYLFCSLGLAALSWTEGAPWLTYALLFLVAVARAFTVPALGSLLPSVIPRGLWANAATWNSSLFELAGMVGPGIAGLVIALSGGATAVFFTAAACALLAGVLFASIHVPPREVKPKAPDLAGLLSGLHFMFKARLLFAAASLDLFAVLLGGATALLPVVAKDILHTGPAGFGWLRAAPSIGAVAMAFVTAHLPPWRRAGRVLLWSFVGFGAAIIVFGLSRNYWLSLAMLVLTGVCDNLNVVIRQTLMQFITPDSMRGRVSAVNYIFIGCSNELGAFESGLAAQFLGTVPAIVAGGAGALLVVGLVAKLSPALRRLGRLYDVAPVPE
jgi:MFS family permease